MTIQRVCVSVSFCGNIRRGLTISGINLTHNIISRHHILMVFRYKQAQEQISDFKISQFPFFWWDRTRVKYTNPARSLFSLSPPHFTGDEGKKVKSLKDRPNLLSTLLLFFSGESLFFGKLFRSFADCSIASGGLASFNPLFPIFLFVFIWEKGETEPPWRISPTKKWAITMSNFFFSRRFAAAVAKRFLNFEKGAFLFSFFSRPENS